MHSRIIELGDEPIPTSERLSECSIPDWFCARIADYVDDNTNRTYDIQWFMACLNGVATLEGEDKLVFAVDARQKYFAPRYKRFRKALFELDNVPMEGFDGIDKTYGIGEKMFRLQDAYDDEYGFYIYYREELMTEDEWMRFANLSKPYYFGGTVDYHF